MNKPTYSNVFALSINSDKVKFIKTLLGFLYILTALIKLFCQLFLHKNFCIFVHFCHIKIYF